MRSRESQAGRRRQFFTGVLAGGLFGLLVAGGLGVYAYARPDIPWGHRGGHGSCHQPMDARTAGERATFVSDWVLSRVDATETQREQVSTIIQDAVIDLAPLREQHCGNHQVLIDALGREKIDREALGQLRHETMQLMETASSRLVDAVVDAAETLTPEQRRELIELAQRFHHH